MTRPLASLAVGLALAVGVPVLALGCHDAPVSLTAEGRCRDLIKVTDEGFARAAVGVDAPCRVDADCEEKDASCHRPCAGQPVARANLARYEADTAPLQRRCRQFYQDQCFTTLQLPVASCGLPHAVCQAGRCQDGRAPR